MADKVLPDSRKKHFKHVNIHLLNLGHIPINDSYPVQVIALFGEKGKTWIRDSKKIHLTGKQIFIANLS